MRGKIRRRTAALLVVSFVLGVSACGEVHDDEQSAFSELEGVVCTIGAPRLTFNPEPALTAPGQNTPLTLTLTNRDSVACPSTTFTLKKNLSGVSMAISGYVFSLDAGASVSIPATVYSKSLADGDYRIAVQVLDKDGLEPLHDMIEFEMTLTVGDPSPPMLALERTLVILVAHQDSTQPRPSVSTMRTRLAKVSANFAEYSYGQLSLTGVLSPTRAADVVGWFTYASDACFDQEAFFDLADPVVDFAQYDRVVTVVALKPGCSLSAWGSIGKLSSFTPDGWANFGVVKMSSVNASPTVLTHELGHTLGNGHGVLLDCGAAVWASTGCNRVTYGDPYDAMSQGAGHFSARRKELMGWLDGPNRIAVINSSGRYFIEPIESNTGGVKALKLPRGDDELPLYVEYRQPIGTDASFGANANVFQGALLHAGDGLLNATPPALSYGPLPPADAQITPALLAGSTFVDPLTGNSIAVVSQTAALLEVEVTIAGP